MSRANFNLAHEQILNYFRFQHDTNAVTVEGTLYLRNENIRFHLQHPLESRVIDFMNEYQLSNAMRDPTWKQFMQQQVANDNFGHAHSTEVVFRFREPVVIEKLHYRMDEEHEEIAHLRLYLGSDTVREHIVYPSHRNYKWQKLEFPEGGMAKIDRLSIGKGLDIDSIRVSMNEMRPPELVVYDSGEKSVIVRNRFTDL